MVRKPKTRKTEASVAAFLDAIPDARRRDDCRAVATLMQKATGEEPRMWGASIVGFGTREYRGASGTTQWMLIGFSPRKANLTLYIMTGIERHPELFKQLGKFKTAKSCLYINRLADVNVNVLEGIVNASIALLRRAAKE